MINLNLLRTFAKLSELGSFTQVAKSLHQPKSRVSRSIARLEEELGIELVRRTTRQTSLTSAGADLYQRIHFHLEQLESELECLKESQDEVTGMLRLTAPEDIAQTVLVDIMSEFAQQHPKIQFKTFITNNFLDLTKENIDMAFRIGRLKDSSLKQRKLSDIRLLMVGSKKYLQTHGRPTDLADLQKHRLLLFRDLEPVTLFGKAAVEYQIKGSIYSDSFPLLLNMALNHDGLTILPDFFCQKHLDSGQLERTFKNWSGQKASLHIIYPPTKNMAKRARAFLDFVLERY